MKLPLCAKYWLARLAQKVSTSREPDMIIGGKDDPYLRRWFVIPRNRVFNIYLHHFCRSDDDRALHDHPWINLSILITGRYLEHTIRRGGINVRTERRAGEMKLRGATAAHRIELFREEAGSAEGATGTGKEIACWTLFLTGPRMRSWGFHCPRGWRHWRDFTAADDPGAIGPGCD